MQFYIQVIHKIAKVSRKDFAGPFQGDMPDLHDLRKLYAELQRRGLTPGGLSRRRGSEPRVEDGGAVFFIDNMYHSLLYMPEGSALLTRYKPKEDPHA